VVIPDSLRGRDILIVRCPCRSGHAEDPPPQVILLRFTTTVEGWLRLDYYLGACTWCGTFFWG
jgi:hypothetical protein